MVMIRVLILVLAREKVTSTPAFLRAGASRRSIPERTLAVFGQLWSLRAPGDSIRESLRRSEAAVPSQTPCAATLHVRSAIVDASKATAVVVARFRSYARMKPPLFT